MSVEVRVTSRAKVISGHGALGGKAEKLCVLVVEKRLCMHGTQWLGVSEVCWGRS